MKDEKDPTLAMMEEAGVEPTRENYLNLAFFGNPPSKLDPEEEASLPAPFQKGVRELNQNLMERRQAKAAKSKSQK
jgi:hypothetical protein